MSRQTGSGPLGQSTRRGNTGKLMNAYYLEIEHLLERLDRTETHYQTLSLQRAASHDDVLTAYQQMLKLLYPAYKVGAKLPPEMLARIDRAFEKISKAFSVLASSARRKEYDQALGGKASAPARPENVISFPGALPAAPARPPAPAAKEAVNLRPAAAQTPMFTRGAGLAPKGNRRRCERFNLSIPARVTGHDVEAGKWQEVTHTLNVSRLGVALRMQTRVRPGMVLHVTLPLPTKLRNHGHGDPGYGVFAIVRRVEPAKEGTRIVGLEFLGERPPAGYLEKPWATFRTQKWQGEERRREDRQRRAEPVGIEYLDEAGKTVGMEAGVTENVSGGGARVCVRAAPPEFETVRIVCQKVGFEAQAIVRNRFRGTDGFERLCVQFVDKKWPV